MIHHALLIHQGRPIFAYFDFSLDLSTYVDRINIYIDLSPEVTELFAYCVYRFLIFKGQHDSDWKFSILRYLRNYASLQTVLTR